MTDTVITAGLVLIGLELGAVLLALGKILVILHALDDRTRPRKCRECGCTDDFGCDDGFGGGCYWVAPDLCSNCARGMEWDR